MATDSVKRDEIVLDPMFYIPEGTDEFIYEEQDYFDESESFGDDVAVNVDASPDTPTILGVISQTIRVTQSGAEVVDVVLDVEPVEGISKYDFRVTKI